MPLQPTRLIFMQHPIRPGIETAFPQPLQIHAHGKTGRRHDQYGMAATVAEAEEAV